VSKKKLLVAKKKRKKMTQMTVLPDALGFRLAMASASRIAKLPNVY